MKLTKLLYFFFLITSLFLQAQNPHAIGLSIPEGLPSNNIYSVFQEDSGILWFTTDVGIVRYDSKSFQLINTEDGLSDNEVFRMKKDHKGRVWFLTLNGKPSFYFKGKIYNSKNSNLLKQITSSGFCVGFLEDKNKNIYISFKSGEVYKIDPTNKITPYRNFINSLLGIWIDDNELYSIESNGIYNFSKKKIKIIKASSPPRVYNIANNVFISIHNQLFIPDKENLNLVITLPKSSDIINVTLENNNLWICTRNGVFLYRNNKFEKHFFSDYIVSGVLKDFEGNYWFTSLNKGVLMVPSLEVSQTLADIKINSLVVDLKKNLWIGGFQNDFYIKNKSVTKYTLPFNYKDKISNIRFISDSVFIIAKSGFKVIPPNKKELNIKLNVNDILEKDGFYFTGTNYTTKIKFSEYYESLNKIHLKSILWKRTNVLEQDKDNVWLGTNFGLHYYNKKDSVVNLASKYDDLSISIEDLFFDNETNKLYVATASKGLILVENKKQINKYSTTQNLNSNAINTIKKINKSQFLIGSNNGLNEINFTTNKVINYNSLLGIENKRIKDIEFINDTVYLATDNGVIYFNHNTILKRIDKPKCIINNLLSENKETNTKIDYTKNNISITYTGISFKDKGKVTYYYKLEPQDTDWYKTTEAQVNFKSLPSGKYAFKVYCENGNRIKSEIQKITFEILPPFWQKIWFKLLLFSLLTLLIFLFFKLQLKKQKRKFEEEKNKIQIERDKAQLEKNIVELEQKALRLQMNPHFIFNALNTIKGYYLEGDTVNASKYISKFSKLLRMLLENEEQITSLENEIEMLQLYIDLTQIRYPNKFDFEMLISDSIQTSEIAIPNLLLQPIVENAIIHGIAPKETKGKLKVAFTIENNNLICIVEDDGIGRKAASEKNTNKDYQSKASQIINERLKLFDSTSSITYLDLEDTTDIQTGTRVIVKLPIKNIW